jgi:hypothetical protein
VAVVGAFMAESSGLLGAALEADSTAKTLASSVKKIARRCERQ